MGERSGVRVRGLTITPSPSPPGSVPPPKNVTSWFTSKGLGKTLDEVTVTIPHDIYVFGTQENSVGDREWLDLLRGGLKELTDLDYRPVREGHPVQSPLLRPQPKRSCLTPQATRGAHLACLSLWPPGYPLGNLMSASCCRNVLCFSLALQEKGWQPFLSCD